ncbi:MAG TPA: putative metal-binding motif-containing protein [Christiangramia sp.]|nr:putative metal-binding motif-containing protein [Christiangramia sp.]
MEPGACGCDGPIAKTRYYKDEDGDGYPDQFFLEACTQPEGYIEIRSDGKFDCNDFEKDVNPGATEICDGIDNNCDRQVDEGLRVQYYPDNDGDGYGSNSSVSLRCEGSEPEGYVLISGDCDDNDPNRYPGNTEVCDGIDNNCSGTTDEGLNKYYYLDSDGDDYASGTQSTAQKEYACELPSANYKLLLSDGGTLIGFGDCNDNNANINPGQSEIQGNGIDDDCDSSTPDVPEIADSDKDTVPDSNDLCPNTPFGESVDSNGCSASQLDDDNDGVSNASDDCPNTPIGESVNAIGCSSSQLDDDNDGVFNNVDNCPGTPIGESVDVNGCSASQLDSDGDGTPDSIDNCPNDINKIEPGDCGCGKPDVLVRYYRDADNDGYPNIDDFQDACAQPYGYIAIRSDGKFDCRDIGANAAAINPGADEICGDGYDNDCDGFDRSCGSGGGPINPSR